MFCLRSVSVLFTLAIFLVPVSFSRAEEPAIPDDLKPWQDWVTWGLPHGECPKLWNDGQQAICIWPHALKLAANEAGATWSLDVHVFESSWVPLPGAGATWPLEVIADDAPVVVVSREGRPAVSLDAGQHSLRGAFRWQRMPQKLAIPPAIGIVTLEIADKPNVIPQWDASGEIWLRRSQSQPTERDLLELQVYRKIDDGIPMWLRTEVEVVVSGKSREESLGAILPVGWKLATVKSQIPVAIDENGLMRAQVRAGKWTIAIDAFRTDDPEQIAFDPTAQPLVPVELVAIESNPQLRVSQIEGIPNVDVSQTTFPAPWRTLPVYRWDTNEAFRITEKMRGMGIQADEGLQIQRRLWLDEDGQAMTYQDLLRGQMRTLGRLDVAEGYALGSVQINGQRQLLTKNPQTGDTGVEVRTRDLNVEAVGRLPRTRQFVATGWHSDAESLALTLTLPPGWRAFAVFGADHVVGDWLTAWSLLDLFIVLIFSLAVFRLFGIVPGIIALLAFGLSYHELASPRLTWLFLLMPIALLRVADEGTGQRWLLVWKHLATAILLLALIPFIAMQTQSVIYPQLEATGTIYGSRSLLGWTTPFVRHSAMTAESWAGVTSSTNSGGSAMTRRDAGPETANLLYDSSSRIQTGPAQPKWSWNDIHCRWNGPVTSQQTIEPVLISITQNRILTVVRLALLIMMAAIVLGVARRRLPSSKAALTGAALFAMLMVPNFASAQFPDAAMLEQLRQRLTEMPDAFPNAAEIPTASITVADGKLQMQVKIHAALDVAVPLPGRFPTWSPVSVTADDNSDVLVARRDGYLWLMVRHGVHDVTVTGMLPDESDWEWTFLLKPKYVSVDAAGWTVAGINADGVPDNQVFFAKEKVVSNESAAYDRTSFNAVVGVDRFIEMGLVGKVRTTVTRLSAPGKAISLQIPLIEGESVLTANLHAQDGLTDVRMGASEHQFTWESTIPVGVQIRLVAAKNDRWVERWHLVTSPVWNVAIDGLKPIFEPDNKDLVPVWLPWPNESVTLTFSRPIAVAGSTTTIQNVRHEINLGNRQRTGKLMLDVENSLAGDFLIELDSDWEIASLTVDRQMQPVQREGATLIVPIEAKKQRVAIQWSEPESLSTIVTAPPVTLPAESSNIETVFIMPENRWVLWAEGPLRGPAVRFWTILAVAIILAFALGSIPNSPLRRWEWVLLAIGLTQIHLIAAMLVVGWLFMLAWRGRNPRLCHSAWTSNLVQLVIVLSTIISLIVLMLVVAEGLLGNPRMFVVGNGSTQTYLQWFQPRSGVGLPIPSVVSISVWFYRLLMLMWALWLSIALLHWLKWGWQQFSDGGVWRRTRQEIVDAEIV